MKGETVVAFAARVQQTAAKLNASRGPAASEEESALRRKFLEQDVKAQFLKGLRESIRNLVRVQVRPEMGMTEILPIAINEEVQSATPPQAGAPAVVAAVTTPYPKKDLSRLRCFKCNEFGHFARSCQKPARAGGSGVSNLPRARSPSPYRSAAPPRSPVPGDAPRAASPRPYKPAACTCVCSCGQGNGSSPPRRGKKKRWWGGRGGAQQQAGQNQS